MNKKKMLSKIEIRLKMQEELQKIRAARIVEPMYKKPIVRKKKRRRFRHKVLKRKKRRNLRKY